MSSYSVKPADDQVFPRRLYCALPYYNLCPIGGILSRFLALLLALLGALCLAPSASVAAADDYEQPERVIAVGDLHGDFEAWSAIAEASGIANDEGKWSGGQAVLVQSFGPSWQTGRTSAPRTHPRAVAGSMPQCSRVRAVLVSL